MSERTAREDARRFLLAVQNTDGGWSYTPGTPSTPEATCYAALALYAGFPPDTQSQNTVAWLAKHTELRVKSSPLWAAGSLTLLTLRRLGSAPNVQSALVERLLSSSVHQTEENPLVKLNGQLRGWPWVDGTFSWVEPTSYALVALKAAGMRKHERVLEAERLLCNRVCSDGGWNYGNPRVRNEDLPSMVPTTALATIALQGAPTNAMIVARALALMEHQASAHPSSLALSWTVLCASVYGRSVPGILQLLLTRQLPDGSWRGQVHLTALALLALRATQEASGNVFTV
jgi:hypothetical protein